jgi:hypothetical protein
MQHRPYGCEHPVHRPVLREQRGWPDRILERPDRIEARLAASV